MIIKYITECLQNKLKISDLSYIKIYFVLILFYSIFIYFYSNNFIFFFIFELFTFYKELNNITTISIYHFNGNIINVIKFVELKNLSEFINNKNIFKIDINIKKKNSDLLNVFKNVNYIKNLYVYNHINNKNIFKNFNKEIVIDKLFLNLYNSIKLKNKFKNLNIKLIIFNNYNTKNNLCLNNLNFIPYSCKEFNITNFKLNNKIKINHKSLEKLVLNNSIISDIYLNIPCLKELDLQNNYLINLTIKNSKLKKCNLKNNYLENLNFNIDKLEYLQIEDNNFVVLPKNIINIKNLYLNNNPIIPVLNEREVRIYIENYYPIFFENNPEYENENIYENEELVHDPYIHKKITDCINEIEEIDIKCKLNINNYIKYFNKYEKQIIINNLKFKNNYSYTKTNYHKLFCRIMYLIEKSNNFHEILKILKEDITNGENLCYTGVMAKLLNSIMGFNIINNKINISKSDQILAKFFLIKKKINNNLYSKENISKFRYLFRKELEDMNLNENEIKNWLEPIYNSSDEGD